MPEEYTVSDQPNQNDELIELIHPLCPKCHQPRNLEDFGLLIHRDCGFCIHSLVDGESLCGLCGVMVERLQPRVMR